MKREKSCGGVVFTRENGMIKYVVIKSVNGFFGFPKGHVEPGETEEETAMREIFEEVGLRTKLIEGFRSTENYRVGPKKDISKEVIYFLAEYSDQKISIQETEIAYAELLSFENAFEKLSFDSMKEILKKADIYLKRRCEN